MIDPASLRIRVFPDPVLRGRARPVERVTDEVRAVGRRMVELMFEAEGIGLAAPQVGLGWRMFVAHVPANEEDRFEGTDPMTATAAPVVYINPVLSEFSRDLVAYEEGCLSLPGIAGDVRRPSAVTIRATGLDGREFTMRGEGLVARCWQHEMDHLDGVLIIDKMTPGARLRNRAAVKQLQEEGG